MQPAQETKKEILVVEDEGLIAKDIQRQFELYKHDMERRLRAGEAWLSTTLRSTGEGIVASGETGEVVFLSAEAERLTGWSGADAIGLPLLDVLRLSDESTGQVAPNPLFDLGPDQRRSYWLASKAGPGTPVEVNCAENWAVDERLGSVLVVRDIRARREMEGRLIQTQRMEAIANMAGGLAHDFNNLLMVILGYADELVAGLPGGQEREQAVEIQQAGTLARAISGQLLMLSRRGTAATEEVEINGVIGEIGPLLARSLGASRRLEFELGTAAGAVKGDRNRLKQIFLNLALNARDAMPQGGELRIASALVEIDAQGAPSHDCRPGRYVQIRVTDSGQGMEAATLGRIFEPFFTTKPSGSGTGLGLAVVHAIVTESGGFISASSEIGKGTRFEILLPSAEPVPEASGAPSLVAVDKPLLAIPTAGDMGGPMVPAPGAEVYRRLDVHDAEPPGRIARVLPGPMTVPAAEVSLPGMSWLHLAEQLDSLRPDWRTSVASGCGLVEPDREAPPAARLSSKPTPALALACRVRTWLDSVPDPAR